MINATEMAKPFGKRTNDWMSNKQTIELINSLSARTGIPVTGLVVVRNGGNQQGTWLHEDLALIFAQWLNPEFYLWCNDRVKELLRHGATAVNPDSLLDPDFIIKLAKELKESREKQRMAEERAILQEGVIKESAPKVEYYEKVLQSESLIPTNVIAKELGMSAVSLNKMLHKKGIIYRSGNTWVLYNRYQDKGYTGTKTVTFTDSLGESKTAVHTYWTEAGREFIHRVVKNIVAIRV
jgi:phage antirepressor YoqD-like protein